MSEKTLTKADIVDAVQDRLGLPRTTTSKIVNDLFALMLDTLASGEDVKISGFGNFEVRVSDERAGRNPQTGEAISIPPRKVVKFKPSEVLRKALRDRS